MSFRRVPLVIAASAWLAACLPSEVDCYVGDCSSGGASSGATSTTSVTTSSGAGGGSSTPCGTFGARRELASSTPSPLAIAVDATSIYWIDAAGARRLDKSASSSVASPPLFAPTYVEPATDPISACVGEVIPPGALALTSDALVWTLADQCAVSSDNQPWGPFLWVVPKDQSTPASWGEGSGPRDVGRGLAVDGASVVVAAWNQHNDRSAIATVDPTLMNDVAPPSVDTPFDATTIAVTADDLFFADEKLPGLFRVSRAGDGSAATAIDPAGVVTKVLVDPDDGSVFYLSGGEVKRYASGASTTLASEVASTPLDLAIDSACVYWVVPSGVRAIPKAGGGERVDVTTAGATSLAVDASGVYLADRASGTIAVVPRP